MPPRASLLLPATLALAAAALLPACGILTFPVSLPDAVAKNATYQVKGPVIDSRGQPLDGVIVTLENNHHVWAPISGSRDLPNTLTRRVDKSYEFEARGSDMQLTFAKDGFLTTTYRFNADNPHQVTTPFGRWPVTDPLPVVLLSVSTPDADLARFNNSLDYNHYPLADSISLPNLASDARTGDITYSGKDANDPTVFPPGTLYLTLSKQAPDPLDAKGTIDPADLDIPHHITLHLPGGGFAPITPRPGIPPLATADTAPDTGYTRELTIPRARLKQMRKAAPDAVDAFEFFYFRTPDNRFGKGSISWASRTGNPAFHYDLLIQRQPNTRDLTTHNPNTCKMNP